MVKHQLILQRNSNFFITLLSSPNGVQEGVNLMKMSIESLLLPLVMPHKNIHLYVLNSFYSGLSTVFANFRVVLCVNNSLTGSILLLLLASH